MSLNRRRFLAASAALGFPLIARGTPSLLPPSSGRRVVIVGGGWGGLTAARQLRELAPEMEVVLLEKNAAFWSAPLSNKWLAGLSDGKLLVHDYAAAARAFGYTFIQAEVSAIDRDRRRVVTGGGELAYDWLILAVGIRYDYEAWFGNDRRARDHTRRHYPCAYIAGDETRALKAKLDAFPGGDLVMTLPPMPYRCPPSPYERAVMIGWLLKSRKIKGRLTLLDPNPIVQGFSRVFKDQFRDQIAYIPDARVRSVDPFGKTVSTDVEDFRFDDAILMPPQQAGDLLWQAGLIGRDGQGRPTGWADQDPLHLHARDDPRIFLVGDLLGHASLLFGHYPKTGQLASRLGGIAAREIAARSREKEPEKLLPDSTCFVYSSVEPMELLRIDTRYRLRGDGVIMQTAKQNFDPNPRGEDEAWARGMFAEFLAFPG
jgi:NADPH-dependent 2,4-dienoyl-CoA reductase/sulfur reductase-like enzyme